MEMSTYLLMFLQVVYFLPFSRTELAQLVERELQGWRDRAR